MSLIKSSESSFYNISLANHGTVDFGADQATGTVSAAATIDVMIAGKPLVGRTQLTITVVGADLKVGHTLNISGTPSYDGLHPIVKVISPTSVVIDFAFAGDESGTWDSLGAKGFFIGFVPMTGGDITSITLIDTRTHIGDPSASTYIAGVFYPFPGGISEMVLATGDVRLYRYSNNKPQL